MNRSSIEKLLEEEIEWTPLPVPEVVEGDLPYATHQGTLEVGSLSLRCYTLSNGQRIFDADDIDRAFGHPE